MLPYGFQYGTIWKVRSIYLLRTITSTNKHFILIRPKSLSAIRFSRSFSLLDSYGEVGFEIIFFEIYFNVAVLFCLLKGFDRSGFLHIYYDSNLAGTSWEMTRRQSRHAISKEKIGDGE